MKVTFEGLTKEELKGALNYSKEALKNDIELWERKEFEANVIYFENGIKSIEERELILNSY